MLLAIAWRQRLLSLQYSSIVIRNIFCNISCPACTLSYLIEHVWVDEREFWCVCTLCECVITKWVVCVSIVHYKFERLYSISSFEFESYGLTLDWLQLTTILSLNNLKSSLHSLPTNFQAFYLHEVRNFRFTFSFFYFAPCTNKVQHFISLFIFNDTCVLFTTNLYIIFILYKISNNH